MCARMRACVRESPHLCLQMYVSRFASSSPSLAHREGTEKKRLGPEGMRRATSLLPRVFLYHNPALGITGRGPSHGTQTCVAAVKVAVGLGLGHKGDA